MGLSIGGITGSVASLRSSPDFGQVRLGARRDPVSLPGAQQADDNGRGPFFNRPEPREVQVGLGRGLSPQGAALRTINATIENARRTQPTFEEIRERFIISSSVRRDEAQRVATERTERSLTRRVESGIPEASAQARNFVTDIDEAADTAQAGFEQTKTEEDVTASTTQSEGEQAGFSTSENGVRLDVSV